jgi:hypothetical protein
MYRKLSPPFSYLKSCGKRVLISKLNIEKCREIGNIP